VRALVVPSLVPLMVPLLLPLLVLGCSALWGGEFGHDPDAVTQALLTVPDRVGNGQLSVFGLYGPGEALPYTGQRLVVLAKGATRCTDEQVGALCIESGRIRRELGGSVEIRCIGDQDPEPSDSRGCKDGEER